MSTVLSSSQGNLDAFRTEQKSQHASQDAHLITRGLSELADLIPGTAAADKSAGTIYTAVVTTSGTLAAGAVYAAFENTGATDVTVNSTTLKPDKSMVFPTSDGMKLPAIPYDATGGELTIHATLPPA